MIWTLVTFAALNFAAALSGAVFKPDAWFRALAKPPWQPPDWVFPVVWMILYGINTFAGWLIWDAVGFSGLGLWAMSVYGIGLVLNASWSAVFFGMKQIGWATVVSALLWLAVAAQIAIFYTINPLAGLILIPYLIWVSIATALSRAVWRLNPDQRKSIGETA